MTRNQSSDDGLFIRSIHLRDLDNLRVAGATEIASHDTETPEIAEYIQKLRRWYGPMKALALFPNPLQHIFSAFVAEADGNLHGMVQVSPFNRTLSTWKVDRMLVNLAKKSAKAAQTALDQEDLSAEELAESGLTETDLAETDLAGGDRPSTNPKLHLGLDVGSLLLRHCFEHIREAQYWISETDVNDKFGLSLYRHNGFQPLARVTYWSIQPEQLEALSNHDPDLPNLLPVSNADAQLIYQLETVAVPPLVRQVFDYQIQDFKTTLTGKVKDRLTRWVNHEDTVSAYVFEPQRKTAIGFFEIKICRDGSAAHTARLTVHPAYTWLYPELMAQMAGVVQKFPNQPLQITSLDYQTEREDYLRQIGALEIEHTLMMSRSVWHKVRESKAGALEGLKLPSSLSGLQPSGTPIPGQFSSHDGLSWDRLAWDRFWLESMSKLSLEGRTGENKSKDGDPASD
ncbi:MAG: N-acetyltransferase [Phormidesmis priestleyi]|uniref:N-acetyltransferase n=1 Tax=Phormidesmis priestleyi TaxID=268141 RepID=A0A2W4XXL3_9CYAN|nr:MAG: N-acetyltransferase [Phormidesmis priestleyi]